MAIYSGFTHDNSCRNLRILRVHLVFLFLRIGAARTRGLTTVPHIPRCPMFWDFMKQVMIEPGIKMYQCYCKLYTPIIQLWFWPQELMAGFVACTDLKQLLLSNLKNSAREKGSLTCSFFWNVTEKKKWQRDHIYIKIPYSRFHQNMAKPLSSQANHRFLPFWTANK